MRARDAMSRPIVTLRPQDPIIRAAAVLSRHQVTSAPVVDDDGLLLGVVSEVDLLAPALDMAVPVRPGTPMTPQVVADVMTDDVVIVEPDTALSDVAKAMIDYGVRCLPVMEGSEMVGVISRRDVLRSAVGHDDIVAADVQRAVDDYAEGRRRWAVTVHDGRAVIKGPFDDEAQRQAITALVHTVVGVTDVKVGP